LAKQIIILDQVSNGTSVTVNIAFWYPITSGAKVQTNGSVWPGASAVDNTAIQTGAMREEVQSFTFAIGTPPAAIKTVLQQMWTARNAQLNGIGPNQYFGIFYDPTVVTNGGWSA
jgi:hypothetical protein